MERRLGEARKSKVPRVETGVPGLDYVLGGGLPAGQLFVVEGDSGAGKTTLGLQFLLEGVRRGEKVLWVTLSETEEQLQFTAESHGWDLAGVEVFNLAGPQAEAGPEEEYTYFSPADVELGDVIKAVIEVVERVRPARMVFDPFSDVRLLARDSLRFRRQVLSLREFFQGKNCTALLLQELPRGNQPLSDNAVEAVVQGIITLSQFVPEYGRQRRRLNVHKLRGVKYRDGYHDVAIETGGLVVYPRLVAAEHAEEFSNEPISSDVPELDALLGGGLNRGTSMLVMGPAGVGKSTLSSQFAAAALARGERVALFLFDETERAFRARSAGLGMKFDGHLAEGLATIQQIDPAEFTPGEFAQLVRDSVERDGVRLVIVDSLSGYMNAMPAEHHLSMHLHELLTYLSYKNVVTLITMNEHGILGDRIHAAIDVSYLADAAVLLRYFEAFGAVRRAISVVKKRMGGHEVLIREMRIGPPGLHIGEPLGGFRGVLTGQPNYVGGSQELAAGGRSSGGGTDGDGGGVGKT